MDDMVKEFQHECNLMAFEELNRLREIINNELPFKRFGKDYDKILRLAKDQIELIIRKLVWEDEDLQKYVEK